MIQKEKLTSLEWEDVNDCCLQIKEMIESDGIEYDAIIGIQRGGLIPAVILSHILKINDFYSLGIRTTQEEMDRCRQKSPIVKCGMLPPLDGKNILVVDDVTNTGLTLGIAKKEIAKMNPGHVSTATLIWDKLNSAICYADYHVRCTPGWVSFPWEESSVSIIEQAQTIFWGGRNLAYAQQLVGLPSTAIQISCATDRRKSAGLSQL